MTRHYLWSELSRFAASQQQIQSLVFETDSAVVSIDCGFAEDDQFKLAWWLKGDLSDSYLNRLSTVDWNINQEGILSLLQGIGRQDLILHGLSGKPIMWRWALTLGGEVISNSGRLSKSWDVSIKLIPGMADL